MTGMCNTSLKEFPQRKYLLISQICHLQCQTALGEEFTVKSSLIQQQGSRQAGGKKHERNAAQGCAGSCLELKSGQRRQRSEVT